MSPRRPSGRLASDVLAVLAESGEPMSVGEVRAAMGDTLAYTTVMTVLGRLAEKGLVERERRGRAHVYTAVRDQAQVTAWRMRRLLDAEDDRAAVLARFVGDLSDEDERVLLEMLNDPDRGERP